MRFLSLLWQKTKDFFVTLGRALRSTWDAAGPRFNLLMSHSPFGRGVAVTLFVIGMTVFVACSVGMFLPGGGGVSNFVISQIGWLRGPAALLVVLALSLGPLTYLTFWLDRFPFSFPLFRFRISLRRPPILTVLAALITITPGIVSLHNVRIAENSIYPPDSRPTLVAEYEIWKSHCARGSGPARPIIVAISGGASRAGLWGARVLTLVDEAAHESDTSIFAVSSVSGGSLGAAAYLSLMASQSSGCTLAHGADWRDREIALRSAMAADALGPTLAGAMLGDISRGVFGLPAEFLWRRPLHMPTLRGGDRAEALERAFDRNWKASKLPGDFESSYLSLFFSGPLSGGYAVSRGTVPLWLANGTDAQNGDRVLTAPFKLNFAPNNLDDSPFPATRDALTLLQADVPISTAITNTARFPYLSPSGEMTPLKEKCDDAETKPVTDASTKQRNCETPTQIIDGGYFENEGLQTALELARWLRRYKGAEPIVVQVTADADYAAPVGTALGADSPEQWIVRCGAAFKDRPGASLGSSRPLQLLAPAMGVYAVRGGHSHVALREAYGELCPLPGQPFFHFYLYRDQSRDIPLNWVLSDSIAEYAWCKEFETPAATGAPTPTPNGVELARLRSLLGTGPAPALDAKVCPHNTP